MRKILTAILCSLLLPVGVAMAMTAGDKIEDKKDDKDKDDKPVVIIIWQPSWPPIFEGTGSFTDDVFDVFSFGMEE